MPENKIYPFSDENMVYNLATQRYILTPQYVSQELGVNLNITGQTADSTNSSAFATQLLNQASRQVYNYIYEAVQNTQLWTYWLAKTPSVREKLKIMMLAQVEYLQVNGFLPNMSGINQSSGNIMDINKIRGRAKVADTVDQIANQVVLEWGIAMRYSGSVNIYDTCYLNNDGSW